MKVGNHQFLVNLRLKRDLKVSEGKINSVIRIEINEGIQFVYRFSLFCSSLDFLGFLPAAALKVAANCGSSWLQKNPV
jgi:hypothetical protein